MHRPTTATAPGRFTKVQFRQWFSFFGLGAARTRLDLWPYAVGRLRDLQQHLAFPRRTAAWTLNAAKFLIKRHYGRIEFETDLIRSTN